MPENPVLWKPDDRRARATSMYRFMRETGHSSYDALYDWSRDDSPAFWEALCKFCDVRFDSAAHTTLARPDNIMDAGWFEGSQLNYAAHLLRHTGDQAALVFFGEDGERTQQAAMNCVIQLPRWQRGCAMPGLALVTG